MLLELYILYRGQDNNFFKLKYCLIFISVKNEERLNVNYNFGHQRSLLKTFLQVKPELVEFGVYRMRMTNSVDTFLLH